jgi:hypothetical protein
VHLIAHFVRLVIHVSMPQHFRIRAMQALLLHMAQVTVQLVHQAHTAEIRLSNVCRALRGMNVLIQRLRLLHVHKDTTRLQEQHRARLVRLEHKVMRLTMDVWHVKLDMNVAIRPNYLYSVSKGLMVIWMQLVVMYRVAHSVLPDTFAPMAQVDLNHARLEHTRLLMRQHA